MRAHNAGALSLAGRHAGEPEHRLCLCSPFHSRAAYAWGVETTVYVYAQAKRTGAGKALYAALEETLRRQNILNLNVCIGHPAQEDEYLNRNSAKFHAHLGWRMVGRFSQCGYKFGRWYDVVWMEKHIGQRDANPAPIRPFAQLCAQEQAK